MSAIVGIDLGTTNSLVGAVECGFPILFAGSDGRRLTPSVVHFPLSGPPLVGSEAARAAAAAPERAVRSVKRLIGLSPSDPLPDTAFPLVRTPDGPRIPLGGGLHSPADISALILRKLKADAERALEREVTRAVITVPAYFNDRQRAETKRAGELAGFQVERILNEPTAAALAFGLGGSGPRKRVAVFDLGGGTFDISLIGVENGLFEVLATCGNTRLGGDDIDRALAEFALRESGFAQPPQNPAAMARIIEACRAAKERLSFDTETEISVPFLDETAHLRVALDRARFERVAAPFLHATREYCLRALADARLSPSDLDAVLLVGGSTRIPLLRRLVADWFGREPDTSQHPDEAVALGAAIQAGILDGTVRDTLLLDVTPLSLGIETFGGLMNVIIPRNTTIPAKAGEMFTNAVPGQTSVLVHVLQGERELAKDNFSLGKFELPFETGPRGTGRVGVQFEIDANGILTVLARDTRTGLEKTVEIRRVTDISDETVGRMIETSVERAFDDMQERRLVELEIKARDLLAATAQALEMAGSALDPAETANIRSLSEELRKALTARDPARITKAHSALDDATQELAAKVIESLL